MCVAVHDNKHGALPHILTGISTVPARNKSGEAWAGKGWKDAGSATTSSRSRCRWGRLRIVCFTLQDLATPFHFLCVVSFDHHHKRVKPVSGVLQDVVRQVHDVGDNGPDFLIDELRNGLLVLPSVGDLLAQEDVVVVLRGW